MWVLLSAQVLYGVVFTLWRLYIKSYESVLGELRHEQNAKYCDEEEGLRNVATMLTGKLGVNHSE